MTTFNKIYKKVKEHQKKLEIHGFGNMELINEQIEEHKKSINYKLVV